jgi:hypothetical protein
LRLRCSKGSEGFVGKIEALTGRDLQKKPGGKIQEGRYE